MTFIINEEMQVKYETNCWVLRNNDGIVGWYSTVENAIARAHDIYLGQRRVKGTLDKLYEKYTKEFFSKIQVVNEVENV